MDSTEIFADDADLLAEKAISAGVEVDYEKWADTFHAFPANGRKYAGTARHGAIYQGTFLVTLVQIVVKEGAGA